MKEVHGRIRAGFWIIPAIAVAVVVCLLAACAQAGPSQSAKYVLTVQNDGHCTTVPSGAVSVDPGAAATIKVPPMRVTPGPSRAAGSSSAEQPRSPIPGRRRPR